jgi:hypothetical protein
VSSSAIRTGFQEVYPLQKYHLNNRFLLRMVLKVPVPVLQVNLVVQDQAEALVIQMKA